VNPDETLGALDSNDLEGPDRLPEDLDAESLRKYFTLTEADREQVESCRGAINKVGFAVQLCTLRWRGYFLANTRDLPKPVLDTICSQLGLLPMGIDEYPQNEKTRFEHLERIRQFLNFTQCGPAERERVLKHLSEVAQALPRPTSLRTAAHRWLLEHRIVRPGRTTLRDILTAAREAALQRAYATLSQSLSTTQTEEIAALLATPASEAGRNDGAPRLRSRLEQLKTMARKESPEALLSLLDRLTEIRSLGLTALPAMADVHPATRRMLASWGYRYDVWSLRRFASAKREAIVLCFLHAARAETADAAVEMQDKLITGVHNKARHRYEELLRASEEARSRAVEVLEELGAIVLDDSVADAGLRAAIFNRLPSAEISRLVDGCRTLRASNEGSPLGVIHYWYGYTRKYSPALIEQTPFQFAESSPIGRAVVYMKEVNRDQTRKLNADAPIDFLPRRWVKHVVRKDTDGVTTISRPHYEPALLTTLNENIKSGDVTVSYSRRWTDFEEYLIPRTMWSEKRAQYYAALGLPLEADVYIANLNEALHRITTEVDERAPRNQALRIDMAKGTFHLSALKKKDQPEVVRTAKDLIQSRLRTVELGDVLIDIDNQTNFLRYFLHAGGDTRLPAAARRRNALAALIAIGCNIGPQRMAVASGLNAHEISFVADWHLTEEALKSATIEIINFASRLPMSRIFGRGDTCSADGMRFYVPVNILAADYSRVLAGRGVTLYAHTADNFLRLHQQPIPCRLREAAFSLDGLLEHDTELDPKICYTDTHGYTEVVMATAALLGFELAPRIRDIKDQTLYKIDRQQKYPNLDPILAGTVKTHLIRQAWDETIRVIASIHERIVSASLILQRLGSYARQNSIHRALAEIGRVYKTIHILKTLDDEEYRRRMGRELNKGEASHDLSRFLCFGKEGMLRGREFGDQLHTFSCLSVLHNAVVAWNTLEIGSLVDQLRAEGHTIDEETLSQTTPLYRKHINPFGRYHFDVSRMRNVENTAEAASA
jgi:TnpA family transposase